LVFITSYHPHRKADAKRQHTTNTISQHPFDFNQKKLKKALYTLYFLMKALNGTGYFDTLCRIEKELPSAAL